MIPKYRAFVKKENKLFETDDLLLIDFLNEEVMLQQNSIIYATSFDFDEVVLMQSTGLKDKNGKEIFDGDIVTDGDVTSDIKYHQTLGFYMIGKYGFSVPFGQGVDVEYFEEFADHVSKTFEVVGNIYENPELLEVEE